jgi:Na+-driven multidrug efflux pump
MSANFMDGFFVSPIGVVNSVIGPFVVVANIITIGLGIVLSIQLGKNNYENCKSIIGTALITDTIVRVVCFVAFALFAEPLIAFMGYGGAEYAEQFPYAVEFMQITCVANILSYLPMLYLVTLQCYGYTKVGLYTNITSNIVNVGLTAIFFYVIGPSKENVLVGLMIIQLISALIKCGITVAYLIKKRIPISFKFSGKWFKEMFKVGIPASVASFAYTVSSALTTKICVALGPVEYEACIYINQLVYFVYAFGYQIGGANAIMAGRLCGMGELDKADKMQRQNTKIVAFINAVLSLIFALFAGVILKYGYSATQSIILVSLPVFFFDIIVEVGRGMNHVGQNGLNATGDVNFTTITSIISGFICCVGLSYVFAIWLNLGLIGMWIAYACDELFRGTIYYVRWCRGRWKAKFAPCNSES